MDARSVAPSEPLAVWRWPMLAILVVLVAFLAWILIRQVRHAIRGRRLHRRAEPTIPVTLPARGDVVYELLEYRPTDDAGGGAIDEIRMGEFDDPAAAIEVARARRVEVRDETDPEDRWWVVRQEGSIQALWIAESRSDRERVIDLRSHAPTRTGEDG